jgi:hypothetical protein
MASLDAANTFYTLYSYGQFRMISTRLPQGVFKILVDGGSKYSAVEVLQFNPTSALFESDH